MTRSRSALALQMQRTHFIFMLKLWPVHLRCGTENSPNFWEARLQSPDQYDELIKQLQSNNVPPEKALDPSLITTQK